MVAKEGSLMRTPRKRKITHMTVESALSITPKKFPDGTFGWDDEDEVNQLSTPKKRRKRGCDVEAMGNDDLLTPTKKDTKDTDIEVQFLTPIKARQSFGFNSNDKKSTGLDLNAIENATTPTKSRKKSSVLVHDGNTSRTRRRIKKDLHKMVDNASDDDDDFEEEDMDMEELDSDQEAESVSRNIAFQEHDPFNENGAGYEKYFQDLHTKATTSNNTLSKLPPMSHKEYHALLEKVKLSHITETNYLMELHANQMPQWAFELMSGFNLLCYGYGSKRNLLTRFMREFCLDGPVLIINGYFPTLLFKDILSSIMGAFENNPPALSGLSVQDQTSHILELISSETYFPYPALYLVIHNIDGPNLRQSRIQQCLSRLASHPRVRLVASIDHVNAPLLWDLSQGGGAGFNWAWHDTTTFESYTVETAFENSMIVGTSQGLNIGTGRGVIFVLQSLTKNAKSMFQILAEWQLEQMNENEGIKEDKISIETDLEESVKQKGSRTNGNPSLSSRKKSNIQITDPSTLPGLSYDALYAKCREAFLVSGQIAFRAQLTEFRDHKIIHFSKAPDGTETLRIPMSKAALLNALENIVE